MKRCLTLLFLVLAIHAFSQEKPQVHYKAFSYGIPALPFPLQYVQPDGSKLTYYLKGDRAVHWYETTDGYPVVRSSNGYFEYAGVNKAGVVVPNGIKVSSTPGHKSTAENKFIMAAKKGNPYGKNITSAKRSAFKQNTMTKVPSKAFPTSGVRKLLVLLVDFSDQPHQVASTAVDSMFNVDNWNGVGSFKQYYYQNSYGQLTVVTTVSGWYTETSHPHDYYGNNVDTSGARARSLVHDVLVAAAPYINFSQFDNDGDGKVDGVMVIHEGEGAETGDTNCIWSQGGLLGSQSLVYNGVTINAFALCPEFFDKGSSLMAGIGIPCHLFGNFLGLPDLGDTDGDGSGGQAYPLGGWDIMDLGEFNDNENSPPDHNCWSKHYLNWMSIPMLNSTAAVAMKNAEFNKVAYRYNTTTPNEYFLLENRQKVGFDNAPGFPGHGMLIYHVDSNYMATHWNLINADPSHQGFEMVEAGTPFHDGDDPFPGTLGKTAFTDVTTPNSLSWAGANTGKPLTNITESQNVIYFNFMGVSTNPIITNVVYSPNIVWASNTVQVNADITDDQSVSSARLEWSTDSVSFGNLINMTLISGVNYKTVSNIPAQPVGTTIYFRIRATDNQAHTTVSIVYSYTVVIPSYCISSYINPNSEFISNVTINNINQSSGDAINGYTDFTNDSTNLMLNNTYQLSVTVNTNGSFTDSVWAFIDWNHDYDFYDAGESYNLGAVTNQIAGVVTKNISVPGTAVFGKTRMRINIQYNSNPGPCNDDHGGTEYGETEDYSVKIIPSSCIYPSLQATNFIVTGYTGNSMTIKWTRGNGNKVIVLAKQDTPVDTDPIEGTSYIASSVFGSGSQIGTGNYVVYNDTGSIVTITGLLCDTYNFAIYEYSAAGYCYLKPGLTGSGTVAAPAQPSIITGNSSPCYNSSSEIYSVTSINGVTYTWTVPYNWQILSGNGTNVITVKPNTTYGNITVTPSNVCGIGTARTLPVVPLLQPSQPSVITGNLNPCQASSQTYCVTDVTGTTYSWGTPTFWTLTSGQGTHCATYTVGANLVPITLAVSPSNACGQGISRNISITVNLLPAIPSTITGSNSPCQGSTQTYFVTNVTGITYNWSFPAGWTIQSGQGTNSIVVLVGTSGGSIAVNGINVCGNGSSRTMGVTTRPLPSKPSAITGAVNPCQGTSQTYYVTNNSGYTYVWSFPSDWTWTQTQLNTITVTVGSLSGTVSCAAVSINNGCQGPAQTLAVAPMLLPAQPSSIIGPINPCLDQAGVQYSVTNVSGVTYTWAVPTSWSITAGQGSSVITVTVGTNSGTVTVTPSNTCGNGPSQSITVTPTGPPSQPSAISGLMNPCVGTSQNYSVINVSGNSYAWTVPSGWSITSGQGTNMITVSVGSSSGNMSVVPSSPCGVGPPSTLSGLSPITVPSQPSVITGAVSPCQGTTQTYSVVSVSGVSYSWTVPSDWTITSGNGSNAITVTVGGMSSEITVTPSNTCGNGTSRNVLVAPLLLPSMPIGINGPTSPCSFRPNLSYNINGVAGETYSWTVPADWVITGGQGTNNITVTSGSFPGTITVTPHNSCGYGPQQTLAVSITTIPTQPSSISGPVSPCSGATGVVYSVVNIVGNIYNWTVPAGWSITAGQGTNSITVTVGPTSDNISVIPSNFCGAGTSQSLAVTPKIVPGQPSAISGNITPCIGAVGVTYSVTNVPGITYTWTVPAGSTISSGQGTNSITVTIGSNSGNIVVTPSNSCSTGSPSLLAITVAPVPAQPSSISGSSTPCQNSSNIVYSVINQSGVIFTWTVPSGWSIVSGQGTSSITVNVGVSNGNIVVTPGNTCGTGTPVTLAITTTTVPAQPSVITGSAGPCSGLPNQTYSVVNVTGVTYTWTFPSGWTITSGQGSNSIIVTTGSTAGVIQVTPSNGCGNGTPQTFTVTPMSIPAQPSVITGDNNPCINKPNLPYSVVNVSGVTYNWSRTPTSVTITSGQGTNSIQISSGATSGAGTITVSATNACGTGPSQTLPIYIESGVPANPSTITGSASVCEASTQTYSVVNTTFTDYQWTVPTGWVINSGQGSNSISTTPSSTSGQPVTVYAYNGCGNSATRTLTVTVSPLPAQASVITGSTTPCQGTSQTYTITAVAGDGYAWTVPSGWTITSGTTNILTVTVGATAGNVSVSLTNTCGSGPVRTLAVTPIIIPLIPSSIVGPVSPCQSTSNNTYSVTNISGLTYTWTVPTGWTISAGQGYNTITVTAGTTTGNITVTAGNTCGTSPAQTLAVTTSTVPSQPSAVTGPSSPCQGSSVSYNVTNVTGVKYTWTVPSGWAITSGQHTNSVIVTVGNSSGTISVTPSDTCGNGTARSIAVTTTTVPSQPSAITGPASPCQNTPGLTYTVTNVPGVTYNWTVPSGWTITSGQTSNSITVTSGSTTGHIIVTPNNSCGSGTVSDLAVSTTTNPAQPSVITGVTTPCQGTSQTYSIINVSGLTYNWAVPNGWIITSGQGTNSITVTAGAASGNVSVTPHNSCGDGTPSSLAITTSPLPLQPLIGGPVSPCQNTNGIIYSITMVSGETYTWSVPSDWTIVSGQNTSSIIVNAGISAGNITVLAHNSCGNGPLGTLAVTTSTVPAQPSVISGPLSPCQGDTGLIYSVTQVPGVIYSWIAPATWTITAGQGGDSIKVTAGTYSGEISVIPINLCGEGTESDLSVTTTQVPDQPSSVIGPQSPCQNSSQTYGVVNVTGVTYNWMLPSGWSFISGQGTNSITVTIGANSGNVTVTPSNACGNGSPSLIAVIPVLLPSQPSAINGNTSPCQNQTGIVYSVSNVPGVNYTWSWPAGWTISAGQGTSTITLNAGTVGGTITVTPDNGCTGPSRTLVVTTSTVPSQPSAITGPSTPCINQPGLIYSVINVAGVNYNWTVPSGWAVTSGQGTNSITVTSGTLAGDITVVPNNACGNGTAVTYSVSPVVIADQPSIITGNNNPCSGLTGLIYSVTNVSGLTYSWTVPSGWTITAGQNTSSITVTAGTIAGNITVTPVNACGNGTSRTLSVTPNSIPAQPSPITGLSTPCQGFTGVVYSVTNVTGVSYNWVVPSGWSITSGQGTNSITVTIGTLAGNISVTPNNACGNGTIQTKAVSTITVPAQPSVINGPANPCINQSGLIYSVTNVAGINYTWVVPAGWAITAGQGSNSITVTAGNISGNVVVTPSNACGDGTSQTFAVAPVTLAGQPSSIVGNNNPCIGTTGVTYTITNVSGLTYTWTVPSGWTITAGQSTNSITVTVGSSGGNITVTPNNACGNGTAQTLAVTTNTVPVQPPAITGSSSPCQGIGGANYSVPNVAGVTYTWTVPTGWTISSGQGTSSITVTPGTVAGNIVVNTSNVCGTGASQTLAVTTSTVPAQPSAITGPASPCQGFTGLTYSVTNTPGVTYTWTVPTGWTVTAGQTTNTATVTVGIVSGNVTVTPSNACGNGSARTYAVTTTTVPAQPSAITGPSNPCYNTSVVYNVTNVTGVTYTWTVPSGWTITSGQNTNSIVVTTSSVAAGNVVVTPSNACGNGTPSILAVTTNTIPSQPSLITGDNNPCRNTANLPYSVTDVTGNSYSWSYNGGFSAISSGQGTHSITATTGMFSSGNYTITVVPSNVCGTGTARTLPVDIMTGTPAQPSTITGTTTVCQGSTQTYSVTNVTWVDYTWTIPSGWTVVSGQGTNSLVVIPSATATLTITPSNGCGNGTIRTLNITVTPLPAQPSAITGSATPCQGSSQTYSVTSVGGVTYTWTVPADWTITGGQGTNSLTVTIGTIAGNVTVTPSIACGSGPSRSLAVTPTLKPLQPSVITGPTSPCQNTAGITYSVTNVLGVTYAWTVPSGWTVTGGGTTNSMTVTTGVTSTPANITVTPSNACGNGPSSTLSVTTTPTFPTQPSTITGPASPCQGLTGVSYTVTNVSGVTYTWSVPSGWTITSGQGSNNLIVTAGSSSGNITVTPSNSCGNGTARTFAVTTTTVPAQPSVISGPVSPCQNTSGVTYTVTNVSGTTYNWTVPAGWNITGGQGSSTLTVTAGTASGDITVLPSNSCGSGSSRTLSVTTSTVPAQSSAINGPVSPCQGASVSYNVTNVSGVSYTWLVPSGWSVTAGQSTNSITVTVGTSPGNIIVTPSNTCGNGTLQSLAVTTTAVPDQPSVITGQSNPCQGTIGLLYSVTNVTGVTYSWTVPTGWTITSGQSTNSIQVTVGSSNGNIIATPSNGCGNGTSQSLVVTTMAIPTQPSLINGPVSPCMDSTNIVYSVTNVPGVYYTWNVPADWSVVSGQGTNTMTVLVGTIDGNISVSPSNACGTGISISFPVTVSTIPDQPTPIAGVNNPCQTSSATYSVNNVTGVTYNWIVPADWTITSGIGTNSIIVTVGTISGDMSVTPSNACGNGNQQSMVVTPVLLPDQPSVITGNSVACQGGTGLAYDVINVPGVTYTWSVPSGWTITSGQGSHEIILTAGNTTGNITVTPDNNGCTGPSQTLAVSTMTVPAIPSVITGPSNPCQGGTGIAYSVVSVPGVNYLWSVPSDWTITSGSGTNSIEVTVGTTDGNITVLPQNTCGDGMSQTMAVTTNFVPAQPSFINGSVNPCEASSQIYNITNIPGVSYSWSVPAGWSIVSGQGTNSIIATAGALSGNISVTPSNICGNGSSQTFAVNPQPLPLQPVINGPSNLCIGSTGATYSVTGIPGESYAWSVPADWTIISGDSTNVLTVDPGLLGGTVSIVPTNSCGSGVTGTFPVTVSGTIPAQPLAIIGDTNLCAYTTEIFSVAGVAGEIYSWSVPSDWIIVSGQGTDSVTVIVGEIAGDIVVLPSNSCGDGPAQTLTVTVTDVPDQPSPIIGPVNPCEASTQTYSVVDVPGVTYNWFVPGDWNIISGQGTSSINVIVGQQSDDIYLTPGNFCGSGLGVFLSVSPALLPLQPQIIDGPTHICQGQTGINYSISGVAGETYNWTVPSDWFITHGQGTDTISVTIGSLGGDVAVTPYNACGAGPTQTVTLFVAPALPVQPSVISGNATPCTGNVELYSVNDLTGLIYTWTIPFDWNILSGQGTSSIFVEVGLTAGDITVKPTNGCGDGPVQTLSLITQTVPDQPSLITGPLSPCQGTSISYSVNNGLNQIFTWSVPAGWIITDGQGSNSITVTVGSAIGSIEVTPSNLCGAGPSQILAVTTTTIPAQPSAITGPAVPCSNTPGIIYSVSNVAGVDYSWSVPSDWIITSGQGTSQILVTVGTLGGSLVVTPGNSCGSGLSNSLIVTPVILPPQPTAISGSVTPCEASVQLYSVDNISDATFTWTVPGDWTIISGQHTDSISVLVGSVIGNISVIANNSCGYGPPRALAVVPNLLPSQPVITGLIYPCQNTSGKAYSVNGVAGETYNWTVPAGWTIDNGQGSPSISVTTGISSGDNITVTPYNVCGAGLAQSLIVSTVSSPNTPSAIYGPSTPCVGSNSVYYVDNTPGMVYTWMVPPDWTIISGQGTDTLTLLVGTSGGSILQVTPSNDCDTGTFIALNVIPLMPPDQPSVISGEIHPCEASSQIYFVDDIVGSSFSWAVPVDWTIVGGQGTDTLTVLVGATDGNITVVANNGCNSIPRSLAVTVNPLPHQPSVITGISNPCENTSGYIYSVPAVAGESYYWVVPVDWTIVSGQGSDSVIVNAGMSSGNILVTPSNMCGNGPSQSIAVAPSSVPLQTFSISGNTTPCSSSQVVYNVTNVPGINFNWTVPSDWIIDSGQGTSGISVTVGLQSGNISLTPSNNCGTGTLEVINVSPVPIPAQPSAIIGSVSPCDGSTQTYSVANDTGIVYNWSFPPGWAILTGQGTNSIIVVANTNAGNISVEPSNNCGTGPASILAVTVNTSYPVSVTINTIPSTQICEGTPVTFEANGINGGASPSYTWYKDGNQVATGPVYTPGTVSDGDQIFVSIISSLTCANPPAANSPVVTMTVHPVPAPPVITIVNDTLSSSYPTGNQWYDMSGAIVGAINQMFITTVIGQYYVVYTDSYGCSSVSDTVMMSFTGVESNSSSFFIYPNPTSNLLTIDFSNVQAEEVAIKLFNDLGEELQRHTMKGEKQMTLQLGTYPVGAYFVTIQKTLNGKMSITRIVVDR